MGRRRALCRYEIEASVWHTCVVWCSILHWKESILGPGLLPWRPFLQKKPGSGDPGKGIVIWPLYRYEFLWYVIDIHCLLCH